MTVRGSDGYASLQETQYEKMKRLRKENEGMKFARKESEESIRERIAEAKQKNKDVEPSFSEDDEDLVKLATAEDVKDIKRLMKKNQLKTEVILGEIQKSVGKLVSGKKRKKVYQKGR